MQRGVVAHADLLVAGFKEAFPLLGLGEAHVDVVLQHHHPSTHLLQRAQAQPKQMLQLNHCQTVLPEEGRSG